MLVWRDWEYRPVAADLSIGDVIDEPDTWRTGTKSLEATIETLLAFNLSTLVGMPMRLVRRAFPIEPAADIVATDMLGRVHLFELKKASVSGEAAAQLEQYLLRHVFGDANQFLTDAAQHGKRQTNRLGLARDIAGVWANERTGIVGYKKIVNELGEDHPLLNPGGRRFTAYRWGKSSGEARLALIHAALEVHADKRDLEMPPLDDILAMADRWEERLTPPSGTGTRLVAERRVVVWLVGASISPKAQERVRLWRRAGIDARMLLLTGRSDGQRWTLRVRREDTDRRDHAERELFERASDMSQPPTRVKAVFYDEQPPSGSSQRGGGLLDEPRIRFRCLIGGSARVDA